ncbi:MAG: glycosyltransferase family 2 protein [Gammaproteobacteria bacterium]|nr:glycosyltransferase family 2 protein [Gammaproteobacteria bacterium]
MRLSIVIINYKTLGPLQKCLESLFLQTMQDFEIIVIDNENNPQLTEILTRVGDRVKRVSNQENKGFGRGCNQGVAFSQGEIILLLNPDTYFVDQQALEKLLEYQKEHPEYGVVGAKIMDHQAGVITEKYDYPGLKKYPYLVSFEDLPGKIAWVLGALMLIPRAVYESVSGFDEDYFLYGEEADLCLRIRKAGYAIGYCSGAEVEHLGGASERQITEYEYWTKKQRGLYLFYVKNYPEAVCYA